MFGSYYRILPINNPNINERTSLILPVIDLFNRKIKPSNELKTFLAKYLIENKIKKKEILECLSTYPINIKKSINDFYLKYVEEQNG